MVSGFRTKCQKTGNRIEACQWIVARPRHLSYFTPQNGVKHDKIIFHEFFCVCNVFSFSPVSLSLSLSLSLFPSLPVSVYLSLSFSPVSLPIFLSRPLQSLYLSISHPSLSLSLLPPLSSPSPSPTHVSPSIVLSFSHSSLYSLLLPLCGSLSLFFSLSLFLSLSLSLSISHPCLSTYLFSLSLSRSYLSFYRSLSHT